MQVSSGGPGQEPKPRGKGAEGTVQRPGPSSRGCVWRQVPKGLFIYEFLGEYFFLSLFLFFYHEAQDESMPLISP